MRVLENIQMSNEEEIRLLGDAQAILNIYGSVTSLDDILRKQEETISKEIEDLEKKLEDEKKKYNAYSRAADNLNGEIMVSNISAEEWSGKYNDLVKKADKAMDTWAELTEEFCEKSRQLKELRAEIGRRQVEQTCLNL